MRIGMNGRLDTLQAAALLEKLVILSEEIEARNQVAARCEAALSNVVQTPRVPAGATSFWVHYTVQVAERNRVAADLGSAGIPTAVYYPQPLTSKKAYSRFPRVPEGVPLSERLSGQALSLPIHPYLEAPVQDRIIDALCGSCLGA